MKHHDLKLETQFFEPAISGKKNFEVRFNDRDFSSGDTITLREWDKEKFDYTGRLIDGSISYVLRDFEAGLKDGYVVFGYFPNGAIYGESEFTNDF